MSDLGPSERLLTEVLSEGTAAGFRAGLLDQTLRVARRRRRLRQARGAAFALGAVAALGLILGHQIPLSSTRTGSPAKPYELVRTRPLATARWLTTRPLPASDVFASAPTAKVILTAKAGNPAPRLSDDELLALAPQPAALVRFAPHTAELVFVKQDETNESLRD